MQARSLWREGQATSARQLTLLKEALVRCGKPHDTHQMKVINPLKVPNEGLNSRLFLMLLGIVRFQ